jgi:uncharacterized membrane protein YbhN (UPF0104 family)
LLGDQVRDGFARLDEASAPWLWLAGGCFAGGLIVSGAVWRVALRSLGGSIGFVDSAACFGAGSLVNSLAPAKLGTAVRLALYTRVVEGEGRIWSVAGIGAAIGAAHLLWLVVLASVAVSAGVLPLWPLLILACAPLGAVAVALFARRFHPSRRIAHMFDGFRELGRSRSATAALLGWTGLAMAIRVSAAAALIAAFGVERPLAAAFLVVPAVQLAGILPLTPGNIGVAGAAVAFALGAHGVEASVAVAAGIAFNVVETVSSLAFGAGSALYLAGAQTRVQPWAPAAAAATACAAIAGAFSWTVLVPLT